MSKAARDTPLKPGQECFNKAVSSVRAGVRDGQNKLWPGQNTLFGEARIHADTLSFAMAYNLRLAATEAQLMSENVALKRAGMMVMPAHGDVLSPDVCCSSIRRPPG